VETVKAWQSIFGEEDAGRFDAALMTCIKQGRGFFPAVGEVSAMLRRLRAKDSDLWTPGEIWHQLCKHARRGLVEKEMLSRLQKYPLIARAVRAVGWDSIRFTPSTGLPFLEKRFIEVYEDLRDSGETYEIAAALPPALKKEISAIAASSTRALPGPRSLQPAVVALKELVK
jgi:hypothetical protein